MSSKRIFVVQDSAVDGVAEIAVPFSGSVQFTLVPISAAGNATIEATPAGLTTYEAVYDDAGNPLVVDLSLQTTLVLNWKAVGSIRATSSNSADTFKLVAGM